MVHARVPSLRAIVRFARRWIYSRDAVAETMLTITDFTMPVQVAFP